MQFIECTFTGHRYGKSDPIKDRIIKDLSNSFITELPIKNNPNIENRMKNFTERLQNSKSMNVKNELKKDLSQYLKKTNLSTRLEKIKKISLESEE